MGDELDAIRAALAAIPEGELAALQAVAEDGPQFAPGLVAFLAHACDWELRRRHGHRFMLNAPNAAIPPEEMGQTFAAVAVLLTAFGDRPRVAALIEATSDALAADPPAVH